MEGFTVVCVSQIFRERDSERQRWYERDTDREREREGYGETEAPVESNQRRKNLNEK